MSRFPKLLTGLFRDFRNSYNEGVDKIDSELDLQKKRVDDLIKGTPQPSEIVDARGGHPVLRDRLNQVDAHLAQLPKHEDLIDAVAPKADKSTTTDLQTQITNLVVGAGSEGASYPEIIQARSIFNSLHERELVQDTNFEQLNSLLLGDIKGLLQKGYYTSTSGNYNEGVNRYNYLVYNGVNKVVRFSHDIVSNFTARIIEFTKDMVYISYKDVQSNTDVKLSGTCEIFALLLQTEGADPVTSGSTIWANVDDLLKMRVMVSTKKPTQNHLANVDDFLSGFLSADLKIGYYSSSSGSYNVGTGWYHYLIDVRNDKKVYLHSPFVDKANFRIVKFKSDMSFIGYADVEKGYLELESQCAYISLQMRLNNSNPIVNDISAFDNMEQMKQVKICKLGSFLELQGANTTKKLKVLSIGNSFSREAHRSLYRMLNGKVDIEIANIYMAGQTLQGHWEQIQNNYSNYNFEYKNLNTSTERTDVGVTFDYCLNADTWDIITIQQGSPDSGLHNTFEPYLTDIINYVKSNQPQAKLALHMTWAYSSTSPLSGFANYNNDQLTMYNGIVDAFTKSAQFHDIDLIIPTGTAIQNARTNSFLMAVGDELTQDSSHLEDSVGEQIAGFTWWETIFSNHFGINTDSIDYVDNANGSTAFLMRLAKVAAKTALINPFKITSI